MIHLFILTLFGAVYFESPYEPWGLDSDLAKTSYIKTQQIQETTRVKVCVSMIRFFQKHISPIDGPRSHYLPTSSQYALCAIQKYGVLQGIALGCDRLLRENRATWVYSIRENRKIDPVR